jgi:hypothetical protein
MRPYTAPDYGVRPSMGGYAVTRTDYFVDANGEKDPREEEIAWFSEFREADKVRAELNLQRGP